jgi:hypothetical protein
LAVELELGRARRRWRPLENGGGTTGSTASCDLTIFGTALLRNDADEVGAPKGGRRGMASWPCMHAGWRVRVRARARGPGPVRPRPRRGVRRERRGGDPTAVRGPPRSCRGFRTPEGHADATWPARPQHVHDARGAVTASAALLLFHLSIFTNAKLEKVTTNLKISEYKSC